MAKVTIKNVDYNLKFSIGFWKQVKAEHGITQENVEAKLKDDFGTIAAAIVYWGLLYGISPLPLKPPVDLVDIESDLDRSVLDVIEETIIEGMTKQEKRIVEIVKIEKEKQFIDAEAEASKKK